MALTIGKVTILLGAGIIGSVFAKEGRMPNVSDLPTVSGLFSGALKMALKLGKGDSTPRRAKAQNDSLLAQVNVLRQELQNMSPNTPIIIMPTNRSGTSKFGIIIVVVVVGYGYVWWKGWKLPDMMFATRRSLSDSCTNVAKQLDDVYSSLSSTRRALSSKTESVDAKLDECAILNADTHEEVSEIQGRTSEIGKSIRFVRETVESMGTKIGRIGGNQNNTNEGVMRLCDYALKLENSKTERIQISPAKAPRAALQRSQITPSSRTGSLPTSVVLLESPSPSTSDGPNRQNQESQGILKPIGNSGTLEVSYENSPVPEETNIWSTGAGFASRVFRRTCSVTQGLISRTQS